MLSPEPIFISFIMIILLQENFEEKERCSGSYRLAAGFLLIKDESISERPRIVFLFFFLLEY